MAEEVKRLAPTKETLRALYLKSGNQCAFPACRNLMIDDDGRFIGQVCHIEAAEEGGERFNPNQTNEERRSFENLMLMCYEHHVVTNDVGSFPVLRLREIKRKHEEKFGDIAKKILSSVTDHTEGSSCSLPKSLSKIDRVLGWGLEGEHLDESIKELSELANRLKQVPIPTRELLTIIVKRSGKVRHMSSEFGVAAGEIELVCNLDVPTLSKHIHVLDSHGFIMEGDPYDFNGPGIVLRELPSGWRIAQDLKDFCEKTDITLRELLVDLQFALLD